MAFSINRVADKDGKVTTTVTNFTGRKDRCTKEALQQLLTGYAPKSNLDRGGLTAVRDANTLTIEDSEKVLTFEISTDNTQFFIEFLSYRSKAAK